MAIDVVQADVARVVMNRPERRNALDRASLHDLAEAFRSLGADPEVRVIAVSGAGGNFCAGADLSEVQKAQNVADRRSYFGGVAEVISAMRAAGKPIIASVEGFCLAGAMGILAAADLAYAADDAQFGLPEVQIGLFPMVVLAPLARLIGLRALSDLALSGVRIGADEAMRIGLLNAVVPKVDLDRTVEQKALQLAGLSPFILALGKEALGEVSDLPFASALHYLQGMVSQVASSEDGQEGVAAFLEKRKPKWG